jgi:hypothetical protein
MGNKETIMQQTETKRRRNGFYQRKGDEAMSRTTKKEWTDEMGGSGAKKPLPPTRDKGV